MDGIFPAANASSPGANRFPLLYGPVRPPPPTPHPRIHKKKEGGWKKKKDREEEPCVCPSPYVRASTLFRQLCQFEEGGTTHTHAHRGRAHYYFPLSADVVQMLSSVGGRTGQVPGQGFILVVET